MFRWCTERLKIKPSNRFIVEKISKYGEVILVLGVRSSESQTRAQVMSLYQIKGSQLSRHSKFARAYVYTPIKDWTIDDVWDYLLLNESPWGNDNKELVQLYRKATGECPLVVDDTTPSCGNSRFGCWVCTLVKTEKSITSLIESGEKWMMPLLELRHLLAATQDPDVKPIYREYKRRQGMVSFKTDGSGVIARGPYKLEFCKEILKLLLETEKQVRKNGPDPEIQLILPQELQYIRKIWRMERGDWQDSVPKIYRDTTGENLEWIQDDIGGFTSKENTLLEEICVKQQLPTRLVSKLLEAELQTQGMRRRSSIYSKIDSILREEWRTEEEVVKAYKIAHTQKTLG
jgi:DNA sulfur modification protein DndC